MAFSRLFQGSIGDTGTLMHYYKGSCTYKAYSILTNIPVILRVRVPTTCVVWKNVVYERTWTLGLLR